MILFAEDGPDHSPVGDQEGRDQQKDGSSAVLQNAAPVDFPSWRIHAAFTLNLKYSRRASSASAFRDVPRSYASRLSSRLYDGLTRTTQVFSVVFVVAIFVTLLPCHDVTMQVCPKWESVSIATEGKMMQKSESAGDKKYLKFRVTLEQERRLTECEFIRRHPSQQAALEEALTVYFEWVEKNHGTIEIKRAPVQPAAKIAKVR